MTQTETDVLYPGAFAHRNLDDGRVLVLYRMIFTFRLCLGPQGEPSYDRAWCYEPAHFADALIAMGEWDGAGTPPGEWKKEVGR